MDRSDLDLPPAECWRLMALNRVGRVALSFRALPMILPVHYTVDGTSVSISLGLDGPPAASVHEAVVAFAVDDIDALSGVGWMVQVQGRAKLAAGVSDRGVDDSPSPTQVIQVTPGSVSGLRFTLGALPTSL